MKLFFFRLFKAITVILTVGYFAACLTPYISPGTISLMALLALGYPYLAASILLLILIWFFVNRKTALLLFVLLLLGFQNLTAVFAFNFFSSKETKSAAKTLRIMTWNVRGFDNPSAFSDTPNSIRLRMFDYIRDSAPDVICMQEFYENIGGGMISNTTELIDLGYKYFYKTNELGGRGKSWVMYGGTSIFSRLPITGSGKKVYNDPSSPEHLAHIDINFDGKPLRIFSTHFKSLNLGAKLIDPANRVTFHNDSNFVYTASTIKKLQVFAKEHVIESRIAKAEINKSPYPSITTGDLNSVPSSLAYHIISKGLQDAFIKKGWGTGSTMIDTLPPTLRIDYLFVDKKLVIERYQRNNINLSDHYPQFIDVRWK